MEGGRLLGFEFVRRDRASLTVRMQGHEASPSKLSDQPTSLLCFDFLLSPACVMSSFASSCGKGSADKECTCAAECAPGTECAGLHQ